MRKTLLMNSLQIIFLFFAWNHSGSKTKCSVFSSVERGILASWRVGHDMSHPLRTMK